MRTYDFMLYQLTLYQLTLRNGPNFHVVFDRGDGFTAWGVTINTPKGARNTDGIDSVSATNGGASAIRVSDVTCDGTDGVLRIKSNGSRGGLVEDVQYDNVCIRNVKAPIYMDSHYSASLERDGTLIPEFRNVVVRNVRLLSGGTVTLDGYDATRRLDISFDGVIADSASAVSESEEVRRTLTSADVVVRLQVRAGGVCRFAYSGGGAPFVEVATSFTAREGKWVGAKFGVSASTANTTRPTKSAGALQVNHVRVTTPAVY